MLAGEGATGLPRHDNKTIRIYLYEVKRSAECRGLRRRKKKQKKNLKKKYIYRWPSGCCCSYQQVWSGRSKMSFDSWEGQKNEKRMENRRKNEKKNKLKEIF